MVCVVIVCSEHKYSNKYYLVGVLSFDFFVFDILPEILIKKLINYFSTNNVKIPNVIHKMSYCHITRIFCSLHVILANSSDQ